MRRKARRPYWEKLIAERRAKQPRFFAALVADAKITAETRGERSQFRGRADAMCQALRLMWTCDGFLALAFYRAQARLDALGVPVLHRVAHRISMIIAQVSIGPTVVLHPGVFVGHGQIVVDGFVEIHSGVVILPWVTIGVQNLTQLGPTIGPRRHHRHRCQGAGTDHDSPRRADRRECSCRPQRTRERDGRRNTGAAYRGGGFALITTERSRLLSACADHRETPPRRGDLDRQRPCNVFERVVTRPREKRHSHDHGS